jgi:hypothetical protein
MWELLELVGEIIGDLFFPRSSAQRKSTKDRSAFMSVVEFKDLPDHSRVWVFGSDRTLDADQAKTLLSTVDPFLQQWKAHGAELTVGRDWRAGRFLTIAVDQSTAGASGCSIDGLFRALKSLETKLGASLVTSGLVFYRDAKGEIQSVDRERFTALGASGRIRGDTKVFDPTVTTLGEWRARFELAAAQSWHAGLFAEKLHA